MPSSSSSSSSPEMDFPYLSPPHRDLMVELLSSVEGRLGPQLLPSSVPSGVRSFQNGPGTCKGALDIHSGADGSPVDFILESWLHCELPFGALDITTLFAFLGAAATDAPHLLMEFIQNGPNSLVLFLDLLPRKDLVLHPDYLDRFYQRTDSDKPREELERLPEASPYRSSSLYIRSVLSPTAIAVNIDCGVGGCRMEEMMGGPVAAAARAVMGIWLEECAGGGEERPVASEAERDELSKRDELIKRKTVEIDLASNLPRLFGPDVAERIVGEIQKVFRI